MGIRDLFKLSTRMFKARTLRTLLTILGMGVGISAILFLVAMGYGIQRVLLETITTADSLVTLDVYPKETEKVIKLSQIEQIETLEGVNVVSPVLETDGQIRYGGLVADSKIIAVDDAFLNLDGVKILGGRGINDENVQGVVISSALAKVFEKTPEEMLGGKMSIAISRQTSNLEDKKEMTFDVIGFVDKKEISIFINSAVLKNQTGFSDFSRLKVKCESSQVIAGVREVLSGEGFLVSALTDLILQVNKTFNVVKLILGFFGAIALIVSAIGMFNTMTVTLLERTEEIGIMKSIGASDYDILWMFIFEATVMGFLGGVAGIILGFFEGVIFNFGVNMLARSFGGEAISLFYFPGWFLAFILSIATFVGFFTGLIPARRASATDPLEALRYK